MDFMYFDIDRCKIKKNKEIKEKIRNYLDEKKKKKLFNFTRNLQEKKN